MPVGYKRPYYQKFEYHDLSCQQQLRSPSFRPRLRYNRQVHLRSPLLIYQSLVAQQELPLHFVDQTLIGHIQLHPLMLRLLPIGQN